MLNASITYERSLSYQSSKHCMVHTKVGAPPPTIRVVIDDTVYTYRLDRPLIKKEPTSQEDVVQGSLFDLM